MSTTDTLKMVHCVQPATGTDLGAIQALARLPETIGLGPFGVDVAAALVQSVPDVIAAIDAAGADPDQLYVTTSNHGGLDNAIWPGGGSTTTMHAGQSSNVMLALDVDYSQSISLWEYDSVSADDFLGAVTIFEGESGQGDLAKIASSTAEQSVYYVVYSLD